MARLIKAVARCGLRFESGLPLGRVQRKGSAAAREATVANEGGEGARASSGGTNSRAEDRTHQMG